MLQFCKNYRTYTVCFQILLATTLWSWLGNILTKYLNTGAEDLVILYQEWSGANPYNLRNTTAVAIASHTWQTYQKCISDPSTRNQEIFYLQMHGSVPPQSAWASFTKTSSTPRLHYEKTALLYTDIRFFYYVMFLKLCYNFKKSPELIGSINGNSCITPLS
jgi:hypothetical protein